MRVSILSAMLVLFASAARGDAVTTITLTDPSGTTVTSMTTPGPEFLLQIPYSFADGGTQHVETTFPAPPWTGDGVWFFGTQEQPYPPGAVPASLDITWQLERLTAGGPVVVWSGHVATPFANVGSWESVKGVGLSGTPPGADYRFTYDIQATGAISGYAVTLVSPLPPAAFGGLGLLGVCGAWHWRRQRMA